jgi:sugar/nucleoside kinase (ribokinase family)
MKDISLYGHLTIDTILDGRQEKKTLGSMANVWKALVNLDSSLNIGLSPIDIGEALIYTDFESAKRYSKSSLNIKQYEPKIFLSKIHHLIYINEMSKLDFISSLNGIITADVCSGKKLNKDILRFVDYLFISDEDIDDFSSLVDSTKGWVILHRSDGSVFSNGEEEYFFDIPKEKILKNVNVLGSGDIFASCFLYKLLGENGTIRDWIEFSHNKTTEILRDSI